MTAGQELHIGVTPWQWSEVSDIARQAALAEEMGFESFWLPENHFQDPLALPEPLMLLSACAALTTRITLATTSYLLPLRSPLAAAEQIAVLDNISNGRLLLGLGRGYDRDTLAAFGVSPGSKRALFSTNLEEMLCLLKGEPVRGCQEERRLSPAVVQHPHPPMVVAAFGPKAIEQAGSLGLPYLASPIESLPSLEQKYAQHRSACIAHGHEPPSMTPVMRTLLISEDSRVLKKAGELVKALYEGRGRLLSREQDCELEQLACIGSKQQVAEQVEALRARLGMTHLVATRIRLPGLEGVDLEKSMQALAEIAGTRRGQAMPDPSPTRRRPVVGSSR